MKDLSLLPYGGYLTQISKGSQDRVPEVESRVRHSTLKRRPENADARFALSYVFRYAGMLEESTQECDTAIALDPGNYVFRSCAWAFAYLGKPERAMDLFVSTPGLNGRPGPQLTFSCARASWQKLGRAQRTYPVILDISATCCRLAPNRSHPLT